MVAWFKRNNELVKIQPVKMKNKPITKYGMGELNDSFHSFFTKSPACRRLMPPPSPEKKFRPVRSPLDSVP